MEKDDQSASHKGEKISNYPLPFKLTVIYFAEVHGNSATEREVKADQKEYVNSERK